jgi:hypothetical protein
MLGDAIQLIASPSPLTYKGKKHMKFLTQSEKQAVLDFLNFLNTKEAWHVPSLTAHLSMCGSRLSVLRELANQINLDTFVFPNGEKPAYHFIGVGDLYTPTMIFDRVRNVLCFKAEGDTRDELESYGFTADPVYPIGVPLPCVLSEGTCKLSDILPIAFDALQSYDPDKANEIALTLYKDRVDLASDDLDPETQSWWYEEIEEAINSYLEDREMYIGTHEGDPACLGVWRIDQEEEQDEDQEDEDNE